MPAWVKKSVQLTTKAISTSPTTWESDPALTNEIAAADEEKDYINVQALSGTGATLKVWRWEGARGDALRRIDPVGTPFASLTVVDITEVTWPTTTPGAARKLTFEATTSAGTGSITFETDSVYRTTGG